MPQALKRLASSLLIALLCAASGWAQHGSIRPSELRATNVPATGQCPVVGSGEQFTWQSCGGGGGCSDVFATVSGDSGSVTASGCSSSLSLAGAGCTSVDCTGSTCTINSADCAPATGDGGPTINGADDTSRSTTFYAATVTDTDRDEKDAWWYFGRALQRCKGTFTVKTAPGAGNSWDISLSYFLSSLPTTTNCAAAAGSAQDSGVLCSITGATERSCSFDYYQLHPDGALAGACMQYVVTANGTPAATVGASWSLYCTDGATGDGVSHYHKAQDSGYALTHYLGEGSSGSATGTNAFYVAPLAYQACSGGVQISAPCDTSPGTDEWDIRWRKSTTPLGPTQDCGDLTYTTVDILSDIQPDYYHNWQPTMSFPIPQWGCFGIEMLENTTCAGTGVSGEDWTLECTTSGSSPYNGGGPVFHGGTPVNYISTFYAGPTTSGSSPLNTYWISDKALSTCTGIMVLETQAAAASSWNLKARYSTTGLTGTQSCEALTYTTTSTLCTIGAGEKNCHFSDSSIPVPANGCWQLVVERTGTASSGGQNYAVECRPANASNVYITCGDVPACETGVATCGECSSTFVDEGQAAGGALTGTYPNPSLATDTVGTSQLNDGTDVPAAGECVLVAADTSKVEYNTCPGDGTCYGVLTWSEGGGCFDDCYLSGGVDSTVEANVAINPPQNWTVTKLNARQWGDATCSQTWYLRKNGANTALSCSTDGSSTTSCTSTGSVSYGTADTIDVFADETTGDCESAIVYEVLIYYEYAC